MKEYLISLAAEFNLEEFFTGCDFSKGIPSYKGTFESFDLTVAGGMRQNFVRLYIGNPEGKCYQEYSLEYIQKQGAKDCIRGLIEHFKLELRHHKS